jgi:hypothetical protein
MKKMAGSRGVNSLLWDTEATMAPFSTNSRVRRVRDWRSWVVKAEGWVLHKVSAPLPFPLPLPLPQVIQIDNASRALGGEALFFIPYTHSARRTNSLLGCSAKCFAWVAAPPTIKSELVLNDVSGMKTLSGFKAVIVKEMFAAEASESNSWDLIWNAFTSSLLLKREPAILFLSAKPL